MSNSTGAMDDPERPANCPNCGTENDFAFTYCRNCLEELPADPEPSVRFSE